MSYELYLTPKNFDFGAIHDWFARRYHYAVSDKQAQYLHPDTGVYFAFEFVTGSSRDTDGLEVPPHLCLSINFVRPHTFALEAEREVAAFLAKFDSEIEDPQLDGLGSGPYTAKGFLQGWNAGNRFGFQASWLQSYEPPPWPADPETIEACWRWNYVRAALQEDVGPNVFVPRISWFLPAGSGAPVTACVWTNAIPTFIPIGGVSHIALVRTPRRSLLSRLGLVRATEDPKPELRLVDLRDASSLQSIGREEIRGHHVLATPVHQPNEVLRLFGGSWPEVELTMLANECVCGSDLIELAKSQPLPNGAVIH